MSFFLFERDQKSMRFFKRGNICVNIENNHGSIVVNGSNIPGNEFKHIIGSGQVTRSELPYQSFQNIEVNGHIDVSIEISDTPYLEIIADDNLHGVVDVHLKRKTLVVGLKPNLSVLTYCPIQIKISTAALFSIKLNGSGSISVIGLDKEVLEVHLLGSGEVVLKGGTQNLSVFLNGSGSVDATESPTKSLLAVLNGSGMIKAHATHESILRLAGSGTIYDYGGATHKAIEQSGSGKIVLIPVSCTLIP